MDASLAGDGIRIGFLLLLAAAVGFFAASRAAADALTRRSSIHPGRLAVGHWMPIAFTSIFALLAGHPDIAVTLVLATSVACLSLVLGVISYVSPMQAPPGEGRAIWPFVLPAAMLALVAGLSGKITVIHAGAMLILGLVLLPLARHRNEPDSPHLPGRFGAVSAVQLALAMFLAGLGAWAAVKGAGKLNDQSRFLSAGMIAAAVVAPSLVFPALTTSALLAHRGQSTAALTMFTQIVLLNLCLLLPAAALLWYIQPWFHWGGEWIIHSMIPTWDGVSTTRPALVPFPAMNPPMFYPMMAWRLDTVILLVLGVMLLPVSVGRWMLGRYEGMGLMIGYAMYLMLVVTMSFR